MNTALALKIENALGIEEGYFMILQVYYDIEEEKRKQNTEHPDLSKFRRLFPAFLSYHCKNFSRCLHSRH